MPFLQGQKCFSHWFEHVKKYVDVLENNKIILYHKCFMGFVYCSRYIAPLHRLPKFLKIIQNFKQLSIVLQLPGLLRVQFTTFFVPNLNQMKLLVVESAVLMKLKHQSKIRVGFACDNQRINAQKSVSHQKNCCVPKHLTNFHSLCSITNTTDPLSSMMIRLMVYLCLSLVFQKFNF